MYFEMCRGRAENQVVRIMSEGFGILADVCGDPAPGSWKRIPFPRSLKPSRGFCSLFSGGMES